MLFQSKQQIANYTVVFPHKEGSYAETYRVKDENGHTKFLKLIYFSKLHSSQYSKEGTIVEIDVAQKLHHPNVCNYIDSGTLEHNGHKLAYFVTDYVSGETLAQKMIKEETLSVYETKLVLKSVLSALQFLHSLPTPIIHNEVTMQNIMLDLTGQLNDSKLIDYGHACFLNQVPKDGDFGELNLFYLAPERFKGMSSIQSDLFSVGVLMYQLIYGELPWFVDLSGMDINEQIERLAAERQTPLKLPNIDIFEMDEQFLNTMAKALSVSIEDRFQTAADFYKAIDGDLKVEAPTRKTGSSSPNVNTSKKNVKRGNGFADVAGMEELKKTLTSSVLNILKNTEKAKKYKLTIPNGMLLYGPPGCGKSFIAEKFAEESGYNYMYVKSSDLASIYVHGSQEKIGNLFDEARKNAPTILCFDEFDALVPNRDKTNNQSQAGEVNEFLSQLNNCGQDGLFVIASTNKPDMIDSAVLRRGRIDKIVYVPVPDKSARSIMFQMYLKERPYDFGIDYEYLADLTQNYVSSDIAYIVNEAAMRASFDDALITQKIIEEVIKENRPSLKPDVIAQYEQLRKKFESIPATRERRKIGFQ